MTTLLRHIVFMRNVFCFDGFNRFTWYGQNNEGRSLFDNGFVNIEKKGRQAHNKSFRTRGGLCQSRLNNGVY